MFENILAVKSEKLEVEARFTLLRFAQEFGSAPSRPITDLDLRKALGVSRYLFGKGWAALKQGGYLHRSRAKEVLSEGVRSHYVYWVGEATLELLRTANEATPPNILVAGNILSLAAGSEAGDLPPSRRLLLAVLSAWSDGFGVVRGLGLTELRGLTGLNENRLKIQLNKLRERGLIRRIVPGVSGAHLFGKAKSVYFLNTAHSVLIRFWASPSVFVHAAYFHDGETLVLADTQKHLLKRDVERLWEAVAEAERKGPNISVSARNAAIIAVDYKAAMQLTDLVRPSIREFQQYKLEEYASYLLSNHWKSVAKGEAINDVDLVAMIASQFPRLVGGDVVADDSFGEELDGSVKALLGVSIRMATDVQAAMSKFPDTPFELMRHRILPRGRTGPSQYNIAVLSLLKEGSEDGGNFEFCHVLKEWPSAFDRMPETFASEAAISERDRCQFGLLTFPEFGPRRYRYPK